MQKQKVSLVQYANQMKIKSQKSVDKNFINKYYIENAIKSLCKKQVV